MSTNSTQLENLASVNPEQKLGQDGRNFIGNVYMMWSDISSAFESSPAEEQW